MAFRSAEASAQLQDSIDLLIAQGAIRLTIGPLDDSAAALLGADVAGSLSTYARRRLLQGAAGHPFAIVHGSPDRLVGASAHVRAVARAAAALGRSEERLLAPGRARGRRAGRLVVCVGRTPDGGV